MKEGRAEIEKKREKGIIKLSTDKIARNEQSLINMIQKVMCLLLWLLHYAFELSACIMMRRPHYKRHMETHLLNKLIDNELLFQYSKFLVKCLVMYIRIHATFREYSQHLLLTNQCHASHRQCHQSHE